MSITNQNLAGQTQSASGQEPKIQQVHAPQRSSAQVDPATAKIKIRPESTSLELFTAWLFQLFSVVFALVFGVYTTLAYYAANSANGQSDSASQTANAVAQLANQVSLVSMCSQLSARIVLDTPLCQRVLNPEYIQSLASQILVSVSVPPLTVTSPGVSSTIIVTPSAITTSTTPQSFSTGAGNPTASSLAPTASSSPSDSAAGSSGTLSVGAIIGIVLGIFGLVVVVFMSLRLRQRLKRMRFED